MLSVDAARKNPCTIITACTWLCLFFVGIMIFGSFLMIAGNEIENKSTQGTAYVKQMVQDWDRKPFIDIEIVKEALITDTYGRQVQGSTCGVDQREVYEGIWGGNDVGCDCLGICGYDMSGCYMMHVGVGCTYNQTRYGCAQYNGFPAVKMGVFEEKRICGDEGG